MKRSHKKFVYIYLIGFRNYQINVKVLESITRFITARGCLIGVNIKLGKFCSNFERINQHFFGWFKRNAGIDEKTNRKPNFQKDSITYPV